MLITTYKKLLGEFKWPLFNCFPSLLFNKCFCIFFKPEKNKARFTRDAYNVQNHFYGSNSDIKVGMLSGFTIRRVSSFQILGTRLSSLLYFTAYPLCLLKTIRPDSYQHTNSFWKSEASDLSAKVRKHLLTAKSNKLTLHFRRTARGGIPRETT